MVEMAVMKTGRVPNLDVVLWLEKFATLIYRLLKSH